MNAQPEPYSHPIDLSPAAWIWLPSQRTIANTFVLFRRVVTLRDAPVKAAGWISADSRYLLTVNGKRVQWGPAPCDPRFLDADPINIQAFLVKGENVIGAEVLFYGHGEGTWADGKPGFIFNLEVEYADGGRERIDSNDQWICSLNRARKPGQYRRHFFRSLQEEMDARLYPAGWDRVGFKPDREWTSPLLLDCPADKPAFASRYYNYASDASPDRATCALVTRGIPPMQESEVPVAGLTDSFVVEWLKNPPDWFDYRAPDAFRTRMESVASEISTGCWEVRATPPDTGHGLTFQVTEQFVGWPYFTINAPAGTIIEVVTGESHDHRKTDPWLDYHYEYRWARFICQEGDNHFENYDFDTVKWLQFHIRNATRPVKISRVGARRRIYDWPTKPNIQCGDLVIQKLINASMNTLLNSAQETLVDGMGRERQQYAADVGYQMHAIRYAYGESRQLARYFRTFSYGMTLEGYFMDGWPCYDRLARIAQRQVGATMWGPMLDSGVGFVFYCYDHFMETGDRTSLQEAFPKLLRFAEYLEGIIRDDGLLPVEDMGVPCIWLCSGAYQKQRHKKCAFNLFAAAMYKIALPALCKGFGNTAKMRHYINIGEKIEAASVAAFWSEKHGAFMDNLPWLAEEGNPRFHDRALSTALLYDLCPGGRTAEMVQMLVDQPPEMGLSYPANSGWRFWALAKYGRVDRVLNEFRTRWAAMPSVESNNTIQEHWHDPDFKWPASGVKWVIQMSHCAVCPAYEMFMDVAGIRPTKPGFEKCVVRPQLGDLPSLNLTAQTVHGPIRFEAQRLGQGHHVRVTVPKGIAAELLLPPQTQQVAFKRLLPDHPLGLQRYKLGSGKVNEFVAASGGRL